MVPDFGRLAWHDGGLSIGQWRFREHPEHHTGAPLAAGDWFWLFKTRSMIDDYADAFGRGGPFSFERAVELGIWGGGSVALWSLVADPTFLLAVDISDQGDSELMTRFRAERPSVHTSWEADQADEDFLTARLAELGVDSLDVVIDDASHQYRASLRSFEILFPYLREGGRYIVEDWQWSFDAEDGGMGLTQRPLVDLVHDLLGVLGSTPGVIARIEIYPHFAVIERGSASLPSPLRLPQLIRHRPRPSLRARVDQVRGKVRREMARLGRA